MMDKVKLLTIADGMITAPPIPWKVCGRDRDGMDCLGVIIEVFHGIGIELPDPVSRDPKIVLSHAIGDFFYRVQSDRGMTGDVVRYVNSDKSQHLGILIKEQVLHATYKGVVMTPLKAMRKQLSKYGPISFYRYNGRAPKSL